MPTGQARQPQLYRQPALWCLSSGMGFRLPRITYLSVAVILAGLVVPQVYWRWLETRTFVALDMPVSLSRGEIRTADFSINVRSWYHITLWLDGDFSGCQSGFSHLALGSRSTVYNNGHAIESTEGIDRYLGHFYADKLGRYNLNIDVMSDPSCLNQGHPRIGVWTDSSSSLDLYYELRNIGQIIAIAGIGLLAFALSKIKPRPTIAPGTQHVCYFHAKRAPRPRFPLLPQFGLSYTLVLASLVVPTFLIFVDGWGWNRPSLSIRISTAEEPLLSAHPLSPEVSPLVRLKQAGSGGPPRLYLDSKPLRWEELRDALTNELKLRPDWVVYVEADEQVSWSDVIGAMDIIRSRQANIVLLIRRENKQEKGHSRQ